ncbi:hypothetical protein EK21DRAFT_80661 [Setomelanomma holmii]|uniref:Uncharacterized protein n=1 Tax=Setomelanomma holmii TaxID=210430 RepID=A0A9P4GXJ9_9PLEO|nr:hypothetical protein EK21DRAFT_80661 [Setomelanomma holmii]
MKYSIFFAATAAAYDAYGGYGAGQSSSSSVPAKISSTPVYGGYDSYPVSSVKTSTPAAKSTPCSSSVGQKGYTTIVPGYGKPPVTVTSQYQAYPTCVAKGYDGKSCDKWEDDKYVSTTVTDYNKQVVTITKVQDYVTVYQEKKTITHYATPTVGGYGVVSTPSAKSSTGVWYELYEKVYVCEFQNIGKNVLVGYSGPGLCQKCDSEQPIVQKEYNGGKWTEEKKTLNYGKPKDDVKVYDKTGVYTVPAKVVTVYESQATGGSQTGIYRYEAKTITITKPGQTYTCTYEQPKQTPSKTPFKNEGYPVTVTKSPIYNNDYGYKASPTPTPKKPDNSYPGYPSYPVKSNSSSIAYGYGEKPSTVPSKPSSTPCDEDKKKTTPTPSKPVYGGDYKPTPSSSKPPAYPANPSDGYSSNTEYGKTNTGYTKRGGMIERRKAIAEAQQAKRAVVV